MAVHQWRRAGARLRRHQASREIRGALGIYCDSAAATADVPTGVFCSAEHLCLLVDPSLL